jgi:two-component system sensor histidine kinase KdpD
MLAVAVVISTLTTRVRAQADASRQRERRTAALYSMTRDLVSQQGLDELLRAATRHVAEVFGSRVAVFLRDPDGRLVARAGGLGPGTDDPSERAVAQWVQEHGQMAGRGSATLPGARALYLPLTAARGTVGVLGVEPTSGETTPATPEQLHLLETFAAQTALAIERVALVDEAQHAHLRSETERLRNSLLSAVSHDLRTPLATITGSASALVEHGAELDAAAQRELAQAIHEEADRLNRLVQNLLEMTRLESGGIRVGKDWEPLEEVVGSALARVEKRLGDRRVDIQLPPDLPLVPLDPLLIEQVLINILDNAIKYTPAGSPIESASTEDREVHVVVADRGPGFEPGEETLVFEKFYRGHAAGTRSGAGLGLAIARGIVEAHGGQITAETRAGGGALFRFSLPLAAAPPEVRSEDG